jgi:hypothetical protein
MIDPATDATVTPPGEALSYPVTFNHPLKESAR